MRKPTKARKKQSTKTSAKVVKIARRAKREKGVTDTLASAANQFMNLFSGNPSDVVDALKMDHDALREFIKILKDTDRPMAERRTAYRSFKSLLNSHSTAEEQIVYKAAGEFPGRELSIKVAEGYVEHQMCNDLLARIDRTKDALSWSAHANVLAEILDHHLKEEERDLFPLFRDQTSTSVDKDLLDLYVKKRAATQRVKTPKNRGVLEAQN